MNAIASHSPSVTSTYRSSEITTSKATTSSGAAEPSTQLTNASLTSQSGAPQAYAGTHATNSQGHAARMALGSTVNLEHNGVGTSGGNGTACETPVAGRLDATYDKTLKTNGADRLNSESKTTRLNDLDKVSQLDGNGETLADENRCAASTVVAGMYYAKGGDGIKDLIKDMDAYNKKHDLGQNTKFGSPEFKKRLESGELTKDDLNQVQENLHWMLMARQDKALEASGKPSGVDDGIGSNVLKDFVKDSANTKKAFDDNGLAIAMVDTDKDGAGNHFVLAGQHEGSSFVYDPFSNKGADGGLDQVTQDRDRLRQYRESITAQDNNQKYVYTNGDVPYSAN